MIGIEQERAARQVAERQLEERNLELQEVRQTLNQRIEIVTQQNEKLRKNTLEIEQIRMRLVHSDRMAMLGRLIYGVTEEISEPVNFISNNLSSLLDYIADLTQVVERQNDHINSSTTLLSNAKSRELEKLKKKINLDFILEDGRKLVVESIDGIERIECMLLALDDFSDQENTDLIEEDINHILDKALFLASSELGYKIDIEKQYGQLSRIVCDRSSLVQVFLNLLINAAQAVESKGVITVRTGMHSSMIWIDIADTGPGVLEQDLAKIFDPFFTTKPPGKGSGLGLHLVRVVVEAHDGRTTVMSREGQGTTFRVMLPVNNILDAAV